MPKITLAALVAFTAWLTLSPPAFAFDDARRDRASVDIESTIEIILDHRHSRLFAAPRKHRHGLKRRHRAGPPTIIIVNPDRTRVHPSVRRHFRDGRYPGRNHYRRWNHLRLKHESRTS
ncbi:MAG: hypothetical protein ACFB6S_04230 [Geminicoccaceae bacterium]